MPTAYRCLYCDIWLPDFKFKEHMLETHNVKKFKVIEEYTVRVVG